MEKIGNINRLRQIIAGVTLASLGGLAVVGCSWNDFNPTNSVTHEADLNDGAAQEILEEYPGATDIMVTHADDNPNYMSWVTADGEKCTAFASMTQNKGRTPGDIVTVPYCR